MAASAEDMTRRSKLGVGEKSQRARNPSPPHDFSSPQRPAIDGARCSGVSCLALWPQIPARTPWAGDAAGLHTLLCALETIIALTLKSCVS